jgi:hypothetical protein
MYFRSSNLGMLLLASLCVLIVGCGKGRYPVHGKVIREDGVPISESMVVFESVDLTPNITARADVDPDGSFELGTTQPGDGAPAGKYRVKVTPLLSNPDEPTRAPRFDPRFSDFKTSGLEFEVKPGTNDFPIKVSLAQRASPKR